LTPEKLTLAEQHPIAKEIPMISKHVFALTALLLFSLAGAAAPINYHVVKTIKVAGDGGWDYLIVDSAARRVYVSHGNQVDVLNADSGEPQGKIADTNGVHGIAIAPELQRGFTSNGRAGTVTIFDRKTLAKIGEVKVGKNPDAIVYEPVTRRVFVFNAESKTASVIGAADGSVMSTIDLGGVPEGPVVDGKGFVFVNLKDKDSDLTLRLDAKEMNIKDRFPLAAAGCTDPGNMAMDRETRRLFVRCKDRSKEVGCCVMGIINADNGKLVATVPIGDRVDSAAFDPQKRLIFMPDGNGKVTIIHEDSADKYTVVQNVDSQQGARTMALDVKTHRMFLPAAQSAPSDGQNSRPRMLPNTFTVLMMGM
jgi:DNA-binding beta-propeller fold protein YncE